MKACKKCGNFVANKALICKYCNYDLEKQELEKETTVLTETQTVEIEEFKKELEVINKEAKAKAEAKKLAKAAKKEKVVTKKEITTKPVAKEVIEKKPVKDEDTNKDIPVKTAVSYLKKQRFDFDDIKQYFGEIKKEFVSFIKPNHQEQPKKKVKIAKEPVKEEKELEKKTVVSEKKINKKKDNGEKLGFTQQIPIIIEKNADTINENARRVAILGIALIVIGTALLLYLAIFGEGFEPVNRVEVGSKPVVFTTNSKVLYKEVEYKILDVKTSEGTSYKKPKEGNEFVVITISLTNKGKDKVNYSYQNWKMTNSKLELQNRIFVPIGDIAALYSGVLVIGGQKTGSLVFEQPKSDNELMLHFYEIGDNINNSEISLESRVFSFKIKVPNN